MDLLASKMEARFPFISCITLLSSHPGSDRFQTRMDGQVEDEIVQDGAV